MADLWTEEQDGTRWLINPQLIVANPRRSRRRDTRTKLDRHMEKYYEKILQRDLTPAARLTLADIEEARYKGRAKKKKGRLKMATRRKRRMPAALRKYWATHRRRPRRRARKNYTSTGMLVNPRKRRRARRVSRRRHTVVARNPRRRSSARRRSVRRYRRNPGLGGLLGGGRSMSIMGFTLPPLDAVIFTGAGMIVPPIVTSFIMAKLPADWKTSKAAYYGVKAVSVLVPSMLVKKFVSPRAGNLMLLGGAASFVIDLIRDFAPAEIKSAIGLGVQPFLGYYPVMNGPARQLGAYPGRNQRAMVPGLLPPMIASTPDRLNPASRF